MILWAYYSVTNGKVEASSRNYQLMNLFGALGIGVNVLYKQAWPAVVLEIVWAGIAVMALLRRDKK